MVGNFTADNGKPVRRYGFVGGLSPDSSTLHQPERETAMTLAQKMRQVTEIPTELERLSHNVAALAVAVTFISFLALGIAVLALGRVSRGNH